MKIYGFVTVIFIKMDLKTDFKLNSGFTEPYIQFPKCLRARDDAD